MRADPRSSSCLLALACALGACDATVVDRRDAAAGDGSAPVDGGATDGATDAGGFRDAATDGGLDGGSALPPRAVEPCEPGRPMSCWPTLMAGGTCGTTSRSEDFSTNLYNVHTFAVSVGADVGVEITLQRTGGAWDPALVLHDASGATIFDGERGVVDPGLAIEAVETGRDADLATVRISSTTDLEVSGFLTAGT